MKCALPSHSEILIVGGGHAGAQAAIALRQAGFAGSITIAGAEPDLPYERPPLSKDYFSGEKSFERIRIRPPEFWVERDINMALEVRIDTIRADDHLVITSSGHQIGYDKLIWATGGDARPLPCPGGHLDGVMTLRTRGDADLFKHRAAEAQQIVVIGGGYIGLESAAVLAKSGKPVVLIEALDRVLARVAGVQLSRFFEQTHSDHGVTVRVDSVVSALESDDDGKVRAVLLANGERLPADLVLVGIGIVPAVEPLKNAGADCSNGVLVDAFCRTSIADVYAIGDCAAHANRFADGAVIRLESVQNANDMATTAAKHIMGNAQPYDAIPWFWSNQYDIKLQTIGLSTGHEKAILRGNPKTPPFSIIYLKDDKVIALDCVNAVKDYVQGRKLIEMRAIVNIDDLANTEIPLKEVHQLSTTGE